MDMETADRLSETTERGTRTTLAIPGTLDA